MLCCYDVDVVSVVDDVVIVPTYKICKKFKSELELNVNVLTFPLSNLRDLGVLSVLDPSREMGAVSEEYPDVEAELE